MRNIWGIFSQEMRNLFSNVVTVLIAIGLVLLPSLFTWFNVLACWDVFANTGNLSVAVASEDEGYQSELFPLEVNVGEKVMSALRANNDINWVFVDAETALDGAMSGRYYAAVVFPADFSRSMLTFYQGDATSAKIVYYTNEKKNAIAPKITDKGADAVSYQINKVFAETLANVSLAIAQSLGGFGNQTDALGQIAAMSAGIEQTSVRMHQTAAVVDSYALLAQSAQNLAGSSAGLLENVQGFSEGIAQDVWQGAQAAQDTAQAFGQVASQLTDALGQSEQSIRQLLQAVEEGLGKGSLGQQAAQLREYAAQVGQQQAHYEEVLETLKKDPQGNAEQIAQTQLVISGLAELQEGLRAAAEKLEAGQTDIADLKAKAYAALAAIQQLKEQFEQTASEQIASLSQNVQALSQAAEKVAQEVSGASDGVAASLYQASDSLAVTQTNLADMAACLNVAGDRLHELSERIDAAVASEDVAALRELLGSNVEQLSGVLAAPVSMERTVLFPVNDFGSAMTPFYATLGLFIGALVAMVVIRPTPSRRVIEALGSGTCVLPHQEFLGHYGVVSFVSFMQSTVLALGNLFFLQVQAVHPFLLLVCYWVAGQVFAFLMYALVVSFVNLGKGIGVILLIVQVTGCGGSFPLQLLPGFVQVISPYLPATHVVNAMRAAMFGIYGGDFFVELGIVLLFLVPSALLGLVLRKPTIRFMNWYLARVDDSKLMS